MNANRNLMIVGDFGQDYETMVPFQTLLAVGHTVHAICPGKVKGDTIATSIHDFDGQQTYSEKRGAQFCAQCDFRGDRSFELRRARYPRRPGS